jgi:hypothetical protein
MGHPKVHRLRGPWSAEHDSLRPPIRKSIPTTSTELFIYPIPSFAFLHKLAQHADFALNRVVLCGTHFRARVLYHQRG